MLMNCYHIESFHKILTGSTCRTLKSLKVILLSCLRKIIYSLGTQHVACGPVSDFKNVMWLLITLDSTTAQSKPLYSTSENWKQGAYLSNFNSFFDIMAK